MKTAVEWLLFELSKNGLLPDGIPMNVHNKAKEMEKQQIIDAYEEGQRAEAKQEFWTKGNKYFTETFKTK